MKTEYTSLIKSKFWDSIKEFYFYPIGSADKTWHTLFDSIVPKELSDLLPIASNSLILKKLNLQCNFLLDIEVKTNKLVFANEAQLKNIVRFSGISRWSNSIRNVLWSAKKRILQDAIGDKAYNFAINVVPLFFSNWPEGLSMQGNLYEDPENILNRIDESGIKLLLGLFKDINPYILKRVMLKLPIKNKPLFTESNTLELEYTDYETIKRLLMKIIRIIEPKCLYLLN